MFRRSEGMLSRLVQGKMKTKSGKQMHLKWQWAGESREERSYFLTEYQQQPRNIFVKCLFEENRDALKILF